MKTRFVCVLSLLALTLASNAHAARRAIIVAEIGFKNELTCTVAKSTGLNAAYTYAVDLPNSRRKITLYDRSRHELASFVVTRQSSELVAEHTVDWISTGRQVRLDEYVQSLADFRFRKFIKFAGKDASGKAFSVIGRDCY